MTNAPLTQRDEDLRGLKDLFMDNDPSERVALPPIAWLDDASPDIVRLISGAERVQGRVLAVDPGGPDMPSGITIRIGVSTDRFGPGAKPSLCRALAVLADHLLPVVVKSKKEDGDRHRQQEDAVEFDDDGALKTDVRWRDGEPPSKVGSCYLVQTNYGWAIVGWRDDRSCWYRIADQSRLGEQIQRWALVGVSP